MKVLIVEAGKAPRAAEIEDALSALQEVVGGTIQAVYPFEERVALICNDEGKLLGLPLNRCLRDADGEVYDVICGTFLLCAAPPESEHFESLTQAQAEYYTERFRRPEVFLKGNGQLRVIALD